MSWYQDVGRVQVRHVAEVYGIKPKKRGIGPCPSCHNEMRGSADPRGALGLTKNGLGWCCYVCNASGDAADLMALAMCGKRVRLCSASEHDKLHAEARKQGWTDQAERTATQAEQRAQRRSPPPVDTVPTKPSTGRRNPRLAAIRRGPGQPVQVVKEEVKTWGLAWDPELQEKAQETLWNDGRAEPVRHYLMGNPREHDRGALRPRGLSEACLKEWRIGAVHAYSPKEKRERWWVVIPLWDPRGQVVNYKFRAVPESPDDKPRPKYMTCSGRPLPLFGAKALSNDLASDVIICEGELDVLALWDLGYTRSVVSGTSGDNWSDEWLDQLEPYAGFVLMQDADSAGEGVVARTAASLGRERCVRARLPMGCKDAGQALQDGLTTEDIERAIEQAEPLVKMTLIRPSYHRAGIEDSITNPERSWIRHGLPTGNAKLDATIGGWPVGLVIVTGHSGSGKTSFLDWSLYVQASQFNRPTLLTSFENSDKSAAEDILRMYLDEDPEAVRAEDRDQAWAAIDKMPLYLIRHQGYVPVEQLMEAMRFARRRKGVQVFGIDHLGYTIDYSARETETQQLDRTTKMMSAFARDHDCVVFAIAHPTKEHRSQQRRATLYDAKGSVSIEQEATGGIALEVMTGPEIKVPMTRLHVDKWRPKFGTGVGAITELYYDPVANKYSDKFENLPCAAHVNVGDL